MGTALPLQPLPPVVPQAVSSPGSQRPLLPAAEEVHHCTPQQSAWGGVPAHVEAVLSSLMSLVTEGSPWGALNLQSSAWVGD